jgi:hypothetical protein
MRFSGRFTTTLLSCYHEFCHFAGHFALTFTATLLRVLLDICWKFGAILLWALLDIYCIYCYQLAQCVATNLLRLLLDISCVHCNTFATCFGGKLPRVLLDICYFYCC